MPSAARPGTSWIRFARRFLVGLVICAAAGCPSSGARSIRRAAGPAVVTIGPGHLGQPISPGFAGLSIPPAALAAYAGPDPASVNPVLVQLIRNLSGGGRPVLRVGGDGADSTWWPIPGMRAPAGVTYALSGDWLRVTRALAVAVDARLILDINLEADNPRLAGAEARAMARGIGRRSIEALELGNEPELYRRFAFTNPDAQGHPGGGAARGFGEFETQFAQVARSLPDFPLAGPSIGLPRWMPFLRRFLTEDPKVRLVTLHRYPLNRCSPTSHPTIPQLLSAASTSGLANGVAASAAVAHSRGLPLRIDEINSVSCGGQAGVSDTFASALWILETLPQLASAGVDGVNIHTQPGSLNELFTFVHESSGWVGFVRPEYYGLLMFTQAAPPGSRLLSVSGSAGQPIVAWATRASGGEVHAVLINRDPDRARVVAVRVPTGIGNAGLELLRAPSLRATDGVTFAGESLGAVTETGRLSGAPSVASITPEAGRYVVNLPPASAAMLELATRTR